MLCQSVSCNKNERQRESLCTESLFGLQIDKSRQQVDSHSRCHKPNTPKQSELFVSTSSDRETSVVISFSRTGQAGGAVRKKPRHKLTRQGLQNLHVSSVHLKIEHAQKKYLDTHLEVSPNKVHPSALDRPLMSDHRLEFATEPGELGLHESTTRACSDTFVVLQPQAAATTSQQQHPAGAAQQPAQQQQQQVTATLGQQPGMHSQPGMNLHPALNPPMAAQSHPPTSAAQRQQMFAMAQGYQQPQQYMAPHPFMMTG